MTLEKLLIFGFALAVLLAITTVGTNMMSARGQQSSDLDGKTDGLANSGF